MRPSGPSIVRLDGNSELGVQSVLFYQFKAFDYIESSHKLEFFFSEKTYLPSFMHNISQSSKFIYTRHLMRNML